MADYRNRMRQRGYKEVRFWVPDTTSGEFAARIRDEAPALNETDTREHTAAFLDDIQADVLTSSEG
ncbi:MAG: antitoxin MazE-like protein [Nakamurella sp.]